jgi:hypothetical protein
VGGTALGGNRTVASPNVLTAELPSVSHCVASSKLLSKELQDPLLRGVYALWDEVEIEGVVLGGLGQFDTRETGDSNPVEGFIVVLVWYVEVHRPIHQMIYSPINRPIWPN